MPRRNPLTLSARARHADHVARLPFAVRTADSTAISAVSRLVAVLGVGAFGVAALSSTAHDNAVVVAGQPVASGGTTGTTPAALGDRARIVHRPQGVAAERSPVTRTAVEPAAHKQHPSVVAGHSHKPAHQTPPHHTGPWLPTGTGMWIYQWDHTAGGNAQRIVARAKQVGLSTLYLRTGSTHDGLSGAGHLSSLLHASRAAHLSVVAWDFPNLWHPRRDAFRLARAARIGRSNGVHVAAVAPDIETPAEGTFNATWRVRLYLRTLRHALPPHVSILTTVPWPSSYRIADYPYSTVAGRSDALVPMAYWYNNSPTLVTARSIGYLRDRFHKPVMPVGQGYDGKLDVPSLRHNHLGREVPRFFAVAHQQHVRAVSLWSWQAAPPVAWRALAHAHGMFLPHR
ncbi:MAG: hypothetical protein JO222_07605 [Frankiales bacterium]|nr:hypothetical protein [Frankiales bacterium]